MSRHNAALREYDANANNIEQVVNDVRELLTDFLKSDLAKIRVGTWEGGIIVEPVKKQYSTEEKLEILNNLAGSLKGKNIQDYVEIMSRDGEDEEEEWERLMQ